MVEGNGFKVTTYVKPRHYLDEQATEIAHILCKRLCAQVARRGHGPHAPPNILHDQKRGELSVGLCWIDALAYLPNVGPTTLLIQISGFGVKSDACPTKTKVD